MFVKRNEVNNRVTICDGFTRYSAADFGNTNFRNEQTIHILMELWPIDSNSVQSQFEATLGVIDYGRGTHSF